jgi:hypothetical protein
MLFFNNIVQEPKIQQFKAKQAWVFKIKVERGLFSVFGRLLPTELKIVVTFQSHLIRKHKDTILFISNERIRLLVM